MILLSVLPKWQGFGQIEKNSVVEKEDLFIWIFSFPLSVYCQMKKTSSFSLFCITFYLLFIINILYFKFCTFNENPRNEKMIHPIPRNSPNHDDRVAFFGTLTNNSRFYIFVQLWSSCIFTYQYANKNICKLHA